MSPDGYFSIVDRIKDMILVSGFNVYPTEVEAVLYHHPKILKCAVAGVPDDTTGERVKAYIVLREGESATAEEITAWCRDPEQGLTGYRVPKDIEFRDSLPETLIGKVLRRALQDEERHKAAGAASAVSPRPVIRIDFDLGDGIRVRSLDPGDAEALFAVVEANRERLRPWMPWEDATRSPDDIRDFIERARASSTDADANGIWVDGELAGSMGMRIDTLANSAEIGYWIDGRHEGRGIVTRACRRFIDEAFTAFGLHRVSLHAATTNARSQAVAERLGMTREAVLREAERTVGGYRRHGGVLAPRARVAASMTGGPFGAAVFDLFGTLVPEYTTAEFYDTVEAAARSLGADPGAFRTEFDRTAPARQSGGSRTCGRTSARSATPSASRPTTRRSIARWPHATRCTTGGSTRATAPSRRSPSCRRAATRSRSSACARPTSPSGGVGSRSRRWWT